MSDPPRRRDSDKSRQELLDEIYLLRDVAGERGQRALDLRARLKDSESVLAATRATLARVIASRSWRLTAPLRWVSRRLGRAVEDIDLNALVACRPPDAASQPAGAAGDSAPLAAAASEDRSDGVPRLYVDVTELALRHGRTGVQRVTREILRALLADPPANYRVQPVYAPPGQDYRCTSASGFFPPPPGEGGRRPGEGPHSRMADPKSTPPPGASPVPDASLDPRPGDVFLGLDHAMDAVIATAGLLEAMHERGVRLWFVCNDVLPLARPDWFPPDVAPKFRRWIETIARLADGIACISRATESALAGQLGAMGVRRDPSVVLAHFGLGSDPAPEEDAQITASESSLLEQIRSVPSFLMVGTLEPRKGHAQALEAFNRLWADGVDVALVIAGLPGWMTEVTQRRIRHHDEFGRRLFWCMDASDAMLDRLYATCTALLAPSEGEGFGLPLVEAANHSLPILCRDLPVFREVAGEYANYFTGIDSDALAAAIRRWLDAFRRDAVPTSRGMPRLDWSASASQLLDVVLAAA